VDRLAADAVGAVAVLHDLLVDLELGCD
jgi:hypothetical protein